MLESFNLIEESFIPTVSVDGTPRTIGLRNALSAADEVAEIRDASPLVTAAIHRLLLAILHRCLNGPRNSAERLAIRRAGAFDAGRIERYFEKWKDRFDLLHEEHPFYQFGGFSTREPSSVNRLVQEMSSGNNAALFDHSSDEPPPALSLGRAACIVIASQAFAIGGGKSETGYLTHAPLVAGATVLAKGETLFETLWLNLTTFDGGSKPVPSDESDSPNWEREPVRPDQDSSTPRGYLDFLTWQSRTLRFHAEDEDGHTVIRRVSCAQGRRLELPQGFYDPMFAYQRNKDEGDRAIRFNEFKDLWRDSAALFQFGQNDQFKGPTCLETLGNLPSDSLPRSAKYRVSIFGLCNDSRQAAKVNFWRQESLPLPLAYLEDPKLVAVLKLFLALAEDVAKVALRPSAWAAASNLLTGDAGMQPDKSRVSALVDSFAPEQFYWSQMERPFREMLVQLPEGDEQHRQRCRDEWFHDTLKRFAVQAFERSVEQHDTGRALKAVNVGRTVLYFRLKEIQSENQIPDRIKTKENTA